MASNSDSKVKIQRFSNGGTNVLIQSTVFITGEGANRWRARSVQRTMDWAFNSKEFISKHDTVRFDIKYVYKKDIKESDLSPGENILVFTKYKDDARHGSFVMGTQENGVINGIRYKKSLSGRTGEIIGAYRYNDNVIIHETFHFLGISDRYVNYVDKDDEIILSRSMRGFEHDIMGVASALNLHNTHTKNILRWAREMYPIKGEGQFVNKEVIDKLWNGEVIN